MNTKAPSTRHEATERWRSVWLKRTLRSIRLRIVVIVDRSVDRSVTLLTSSLFQGRTAERIVNHETLQVDLTSRLN